MTHSLGYTYANRTRYDGWNRPRWGRLRKRVQFLISA